MSGNKPDFRLVASESYNPNNPDAKRASTRIGAAWKIVKNEKTIGINIKIDKALPPLLLSSRVDLTLWREDDREDGRSKQAAPEDEFGDDDIPF